MDISPSGATSASDRQAKEDQFHGLRNLFDAIDNAPQTIVAMITGPCLGGGVGLAMACDVRIAIETATFTLSETKLGLVPAVISK
jgi:hydroxymethylglutaryl-CoA lyase